MHPMYLLQNSNILLQVSSESAQNFWGSEELKMHFNFIASFQTCSNLTLRLPVFEKVQHFKCYAERLDAFSQDIQQQGLAHSTCTDQGWIRLCCEPVSPRSTSDALESNSNNPLNSDTNTHSSTEHFKDAGIQDKC